MATVPSDRRPLEMKKRLRAERDFRADKWGTIEERTFANSEIQEHKHVFERPWFPRSPREPFLARR